MRFIYHMKKTIPIVNARQQLANLVASSERGGVVAITRRGKPVVVMISTARYARLTGDIRKFSEAVLELRDELDVENLGIDDDTFSDLRDPSIDRKVMTTNSTPAGSSVSPSR
jgi:prevent-host-death family protein